MQVGLYLVVALQALQRHLHPQQAESRVKQLSVQSTEQSKGCWTSAEGACCAQTFPELSQGA